MTGEEMERAIQFLIEHHAKVSTEIEGLNDKLIVSNEVARDLSNQVARLRH